MFVTPMIGAIPTDIYARPRGSTFSRPEQASRLSTGSDASSLHRTSSSSSSTSASSVASDDTQGRHHRRSLSGGNFHLPRALQPFHKKALSQSHSPSEQTPKIKTKPRSQSQSQSQPSSQAQPKPKPPLHAPAKLQKPNPKPHSRPPLSHRNLPSPPATPQQQPRQPPPPRPRRPSHEQLPWKDPNALRPTLDPALFTNNTKLSPMSPTLPTRSSSLPSKNSSLKTNVTSSTSTTSNPGLVSPNSSTSTTPTSPGSPVTPKTPTTPQIPITPKTPTMPVTAFKPRSPTFPPSPSLPISPTEPKSPYLPSKGFKLPVISPTMPLITSADTPWQCSDLVVRCKGDLYHVDRTIMCYHSRWFARICAIMKTSKASKSVIDLSADDPDAIAAMMQYCYQLNYNEKTTDFNSSVDEVANLRPHVDIYMLAERYGIDGLKELALEKFERLAIAVLVIHGNKEHLLQAVRAIYEPSRRANADELRRVAIRICADHVEGFISGNNTTMALVFESMDELPDFRADLFEEMALRWK